MEMDCSGDVLTAFLDYLYGGVLDVTIADAVELLNVAKSYGLSTFAKALESELRASLDSSNALEVLLQIQNLGAKDLRQACEEHIAQNFESCIQRSGFVHLTAKQLQRLLERDDLQVSREEVVVQGLLHWSSAARQRSSDPLGLLLCDVDLPSLAIRNLELLWQTAECMGSHGAELKWEVEDALQIHRSWQTSASQQHISRRRCLPHWAPLLGAGMNSYPLSGQKISPLIETGTCLRWHGGSFYLANREKRQILSCKAGESFQIHAGEDVEVEGFDPLENWSHKAEVFLATSPLEDLLLACRDIDQDPPEGCALHRVLLIQFSAGSSKVLLDIPDLAGFCYSPNGILYVLDAHGTRVQRLDGSTFVPVIRSSQLQQEQRFRASYLFAASDESLYINDAGNKRFLHVSPDGVEVHVILDYQKMDHLGELDRFFVTEDGGIYAVDVVKRKVVMVGSKTAYDLALDLPKHGSPVDVLLMSEPGCLALYVSVTGCEGGIYRYELPCMKLDLSNSELGSSPSSPVSDCQRSCSRSTISTFFGDERSSYLV